jgi:hypothetical protein
MITKFARLEFELFTKPSKNDKNQACFVLGRAIRAKSGKPFKIQGC